MKTQKIIRLVALKLGLLMLIALAGATLAFAVKLPNQSIPGNGNWTTSVPFTVSDTGKLTVRVKLRVNTPFGVPLLGESQYEAALVKMSAPTTNLISVKRNVTASFETVTLEYDISNCSKTGSYAIRLRNSGDINKQAGEAEFPEFYPPILLPASSGTIPDFGVTQNNEIFMDIPSSLEPTGSGGTLKVTATWLNICPALDLYGCKLRFQLVRMVNGNPVDVGLSNTGYAHDAAGGTANPKMTLEVKFPDALSVENLANENFKLKIKGDPRGDVRYVKATIKYIPKCGS